MEQYRALDKKKRGNLIWREVFGEGSPAWKARYDPRWTLYWMRVYGMDTPEGFEGVQESLESWN